MFLDSIHHPILIYKTPSYLYLKTQRLEAVLYLHRKVKPTQLVPVGRASHYLWTEFSLRNIF
jgi:hypothetical protein